MNLYLQGMFVAQGESRHAQEGHWVVIYCWLVTWDPSHTNKMDYVMKIFIEYDSARGGKTYSKRSGPEGKETYFFSCGDSLF